jgi:hypothetical protein
MTLEDHKTRFGWLELELIGVNDWYGFRQIADWLTRDAAAWRLWTVQDAVQDTAYWDYWLGGILGGRIVLHFHYAAGTSLYATGPLSSRALSALRPRLEKLPEVMFTRPHAS